VTLLDREPLYAELRRRDLDKWEQSLRQLCNARLDPSSHGNMPKWLTACQQLPVVADATFDARAAAVTVHGSLPETAQQSLRSSLLQLHPWRKGPFQLFDVTVDAEWRSDLKWNRLCQSVDLRGKFVLDVGSGNGYYGWKMLAAGAEFVIGCDPMLLYVMQFEAIARYAPLPSRHFVVPVADAELPARLHAFDVTFSMGVLYHRTSPIDHLQFLRGSLRPRGQLMLETLIVQADDARVLVPQDRYAKMRNVWFIPSLPMLQRWLKRTGFEAIEVVDVSKTTGKEQRSTAWMTFESLADFLDPDDPQLTVEGYPAPVRATLLARAR
jgi:tRNA (mo5U34)-methyltransferase